MAERLSRRSREREADGDNVTGEKCMKLAGDGRRVDEEGPERVIISTGTRFLLGQV